MKRIIMWTCILTLALLLPHVAQAEESVLLPGLGRANHLRVEGNQIYVASAPYIYIYSKKDFKLKKKVGKQGEGPGEFVVSQESGISLNLRENDFIVESVGKLSCFAKDGTFLKDIKSNKGFVFCITPVGKNFTAVHRTRENNIQYNVLSLYGPDFEKISSLYKLAHMLQDGKGLEVFAPLPFAFKAYKNKIYVAWNWDFRIKVFDHAGKEIKQIKLDIPRLPITSEHKKAALKFFEESPRFKQFLHIFKPYQFADNFPAIKDFTISDDKIYVITYKEKESMSQVIVMDLEGKILKKTYLPLRGANVRELYPFAVEKGKFYQLQENEEEEEWELHIMEI